MKLNKGQLRKEKRYGIIEFDIDFLFHFHYLKDYIVPINIKSMRRLDKIIRHRLYCLSPYFESTNEIMIKDLPQYIFVYEKDKLGNVVFKEMTKI